MVQAILDGRRMGSPTDPARSLVPAMRLGEKMSPAAVYPRIYAMVRQIPCGQVPRVVQLPANTHVHYPLMNRDKQSPNTVIIDYYQVS